MQNRYSRILLPLLQQRLFNVEVREINGNKNSKQKSQPHITAAQV